MSFRYFVIAIAAIASVSALIAVIFQDNLTRFLLKPSIPYQLYEPPPPPAYGARGAWVIWPEDPNRPVADVFYIHSTTYRSSDHWNAPIANETADVILRRVAAPNEAGPFFAAGAVYGPRYRQATLFSRFTHKFDGLAARRLAFEDIAQAFEIFLKDRTPNRPFIIAGYEQGGLHALGLLQHYVARDETLRRDLAAAYIIGAAVPLSIVNDPDFDIPPCEGPEDVRCVISYIDFEPGFDDEKRRMRRRSLAWAEDRNLLSLSRGPLLCTNPISWTTDADRNEADQHVGAASATGLRSDETPPTIARAIGAQCVDGVLAVDQPRQRFLRRQKWFGGKWRTRNFNLFYHDLAANSRARALRLEEILVQEAQISTNADDDVNP